MAKKSSGASFLRLNKSGSDSAWTLDWSRIDRSGPFPWPDSNTELFYLLAGYLAKLNELPFYEVKNLQRINGESAVHLLENMDDAGWAQWDEIYRQGNFDSRDSPYLARYTLTYCISQMDARRVIIVLDGEKHVAYPLWWDPDHLVSGSNRKTTPKLCNSEACYHQADLG